MIDLLGSAVTTTATFGAGIGQIVLSEVRCYGTEERLVDCPTGAATTCSTGHNEDVGIICQARTGTNISMLLCCYA